MMVFEWQIYHLVSKADQLVSALELGAVYNVKLRASTIASGRKNPWKGKNQKDRMFTI